MKIDHLIRLNKRLKILFLVETATGRRNVTFQHVLTLPHSRTGSQVK